MGIRAPHTVSLLALVLVSRAACGGAVVRLNDEASLELGLRVQVQGIVTDKDRDGDGEQDSDTDFKLRRARLYLKGNGAQYVQAFLQTEVGGAEDGTGRDWRLVDGWVRLRPHPLCTFYAGQHMVASSRQGVTTCTALLAIDRPGINYKALSWGTRSMSAFANNTLADSDAGLRADEAVRDTGITLFGTHSLSDNLHLKYYAGAYDGIQLAQADRPRLTARIQLNLLDAESGYFNRSCYLGNKRTIGFGASFDRQEELARSDDRGHVDYLFYSGDVFADLPVCGGQLNVELALSGLELGATSALDHDGDPATPGRNARRAEGVGGYLQAGFLLGAWQPWVAVEHWDSQAGDDRGSHDIVRAGITYYMRKHNAKIKAGYERLKAATDIGTTSDDTINSVVVGCYVHY